MNFLRANSNIVFLIRGWSEVFKKRC